MYQDAIDQRRLKQFILPQRQLMDLLSWRIMGTGELRMPQIIGVPQDARIVGVDWLISHLGFAVIIQHNSFDPVPDGHCIPTDVLPLEVEPAILRRDETGAYHLTCSRKSCFDDAPTKDRGLSCFGEALKAMEALEVGQRVVMNEPIGGEIEIHSCDFDGAQVTINGEPAGTVRKWTLTPNRFKGEFILDPIDVRELELMKTRPDLFGPRHIRGYVRDDEAANARSLRDAHDQRLIGEAIDRCINGIVERGEKLEMGNTNFPPMTPELPMTTKLTHEDPPAESWRDRPPLF
jgi:hypothetical protein